MSRELFKFQTPVRVRWMECDAQGIVFFGAYTNYLEVAQSEYFRNLGFSIYRIAERSYFDTAVVKLIVEYKAPARVDDMLDLLVRISRIGNSSMTLELNIYRQEDGELLTVMEAVHAGFDASTGRSKPVPPDIRRLIDHFESTGEVLPLESFPALAKAAAPDLDAL